MSKEIEEKRGSGDLVQRKSVNDSVQDADAAQAFLKLRGSIKVGPGDVVEDIRKARELMGIVDL